jgi:hypothetical protein
MRQISMMQELAVAFPERDPNLVQRISMAGFFNGVLN